MAPSSAGTVVSPGAEQRGQHVLLDGKRGVVGRLSLRLRQHRFGAYIADDRHVGPMAGEGHPRQPGSVASDDASR